jgi:hypothetical protein
MRGLGHSRDPENGHPGRFQAPIVRNGHFSTGQFDGFLGVFFQKFQFWALYGIPEILRRRKPACLELFGLRIGWRGGVTYGGGVVFWNFRAVLDSNFTSINSESPSSHIPNHLSGPGHSRDPENGHPCQVFVTGYLRLSIRAVKY